MRDQLAHRYFDTDHAVVDYVVHEELTSLRAAVSQLIDEGATPIADPRDEEPR